MGYRPSPLPFAAPGTAGARGNRVVEHHSGRRSTRGRSGAGTGPAARAHHHATARRRPPEAPRPDHIPILVTVPRAEVVEVAWPSRVGLRIVAATVVASLVAGSIATVCAILPHG